MKFPRRWFVILGATAMAYTLIALWPMQQQIGIAVRAKTADWQKRWQDWRREPVHLVVELMPTGQIEFRENGKVRERISDCGDVDAISTATNRLTSDSASMRIRHIDSMEIRLPENRSINEANALFYAAILMPCRLVAVGSGNQETAATQYFPGICEHCAAQDRAMADIIWANPKSRVLDLQIEAPGGGVYESAEFDLQTSAAVLNRVAESVRKRDASVTKPDSLCLLLTTHAHLTWGDFVRGISALNQKSVHAIFVRFQDEPSDENQEQTAETIRQTLHMDSLRNAKEFRDRLRSRRQPPSPVLRPAPGPGRPASR